MKQSELKEVAKLAREHTSVTNTTVKTIVEDLKKQLLACKTIPEKNELAKNIAIILNSGSMANQTNVNAEIAVCKMIETDLKYNGIKS